MNNNSIGVILLCLFVFILLTGTFYVLIHTLVTSLILNIKCGADDEHIKKEYEDFVAKHGSRKKKAVNFIFSTLSFLVSAALVVIIGYTLATSNKVVNDIPVLKVVESGSMSYKNKNNKYLVDNNLNNQVGMDDLILLEKLPAEKDLKKYDIILYRHADGRYILHRLIDSGIDSEGKIKYKFQGDANKYHDPDEVYYDQMLGIYKGKHIPHLGNFVKFIQSPAGILCIALIVLVAVIYPIIDKKMLMYKRERLLQMGYTIEELIQNKYTKK